MPLRSINRESEASRDREDALFEMRIPPTREQGQGRKFSNICVEDIEIGALV